MKHLFAAITVLSVAVHCFAKTDSLLNSLQTPASAQQELFPKKMLFTQRLVWGSMVFSEVQQSLPPK